MQQLSPSGGANAQVRNSSIAAGVEALRQLADRPLLGRPGHPSGCGGVAVARRRSSRARPPRGHPIAPRGISNDGSPGGSVVAERRSTGSSVAPRASTGIERPSSHSHPACAFRGHAATPVACEAMANAVLLVACPDRRGIVAAVASFVTANGGNIVDLQQHTDHTDGSFFQRVEFELDGLTLSRDEIAAAAEPVVDAVLRCAGRCASPTSVPRRRARVAGVALPQRPPPPPAQRRAGDRRSRS